MRRLLVLLFCALLVAPAPVARADALPPPPPRPVWDDPPAPLPAPPEEVWRRLTAMALLALAAAATLVLARRTDRWTGRGAR